MKYVFVCGMPRSGTTVLAKQIAGLPGCTGFENTGVIMDEGQYLQDVYPTEWACGGAGRFGFSPQAHLTESSLLLTPANASRLRECWERHWDRNKTICVEKSPGNLLKTRFLQEVFPQAYFIIVRRHPVAVSLATQKWSRTPLHELLEHWLRCQQIFEEDKNRLMRLYELSYEDYITDPAKYLREMADFIGAAPESSGVDVGDGYNKRYFDRWAQMLETSTFRPYYRRVCEEYHPKFLKYGYSLVCPSGGVPLARERNRSIRTVAASLLYKAADVSCIFWRMDQWLRVRAHSLVDHHFRSQGRALLDRN